jgi:membrane protein
LFGGLLNVQDKQVSRQLFHELAQLFGYQGARQLRDISHSLSQRRSGPAFTALNIFLLLLASTTLFAIIKRSLNQLWMVKSIANRPWTDTLLERLVALGIIIFSGVLVTLSLAIQQALLTIFPDAIQYDWLLTVGKHLLSVLLLTVWFSVVFKYLPDIRIRWQGVWVGALVTALLIEAGEKILDRLLINSDVSSLYGTSGPIILVLLFVFYSSLIFYYGASFTRQYARWIHLEARPTANAIAFEINDIESKEVNFGEE